MTKVTIIGQEPQEKGLKKIEFIKCCLNDRWSNSVNNRPSEWQNIELISLSFSRGLDLMFAYDENRSEGVIYLGHFNDGVV